MKHNRIKEVLACQGRSQQWLSKNVGKSYPVISGYCRNHRQPSLCMIYKIARVLEVPVIELLNEPEKVEK